MFKTFEEVKNFQKNLKPSNNDNIILYFNSIYHNLLMREETPNADINEYNNRNLFLNKAKSFEKGITLKVFIQYFDIQEFICNRIFKYLNKSKTGKLSKNEFINGLYTIFFGNFSDLYKFTFFLCDFKENSKIHKINMNIILSYIPKKNHEEQYEYIKHIKTINNHYFASLDKQYPEKNIGLDKEIEFELYEKCIEAHIKEENEIKKDDNYNFNGSFFLFIKLISYIYEKHPFLSENMNYCQYLKNKSIVKNIQCRYKYQNQEKKNLSKFSTTANEKIFSKNLFSEINNRNLGRQRQNSHVKEKEKEKELILPKIELFHTSKRSFSLYNSKKQNNNNKKELKLMNKIIEEENILKSYKNNQLYSSINSKKKYIPNHVLKNNNILMKSVQLSEGNAYKFGNTFKNKAKVRIETESSHISPNKQRFSKYIFNNDLNNNDNDYEEDYEEDDKNKNNIIQANNNDEYSDIIFKFCEEENSNIIKKYYACLKGKDILFFSSKQKNELCCIWNINKAIIKIGDRTDISKYSFYPIKFTYFNGSYSFIYFEEKENQLKFAKKCEENTYFLKIENLFEIKEKIGQGHFGVVKRCIEKSTGKEYAVKIMNKSKIEKDLQLVIQERNYMILIKHPNIVSLIQDFEDETYLYFVMEYFKGGDLSKYLLNIKNSENNDKNLEKISAKIIKIIAQGVQYLNNFGIVHRDLKPENIIFEKENDIKSIKIIDLGVAITLPYGEESSDPIGTLTYIAPEIFQHNPYSHKIDVWSIGILLYFLATGGSLPFDDEKGDEKMIGKKIVYTHQEYPANYFGNKSRALICLIDKALEKSPEKRISINEFLKEEWLNKYSK